jgi:twitching motility protein PilI
MSADDMSIDSGVEEAARIDAAFIDAFETLAEYERRSLAHVAGLPEQLQAAGLWRGIGFRIGQRRLVCDYEAVAEILTVPQITPVPGAYSWMLGVANVRSNLLPVVDLKQFLEGARSVLHEGHQKVMVLRQPGGDVAVTIDELYGQRSFMDEQQVEPEGLADGRYAGFIDRAYRIADDVWGVFNLDRLVRTPEFRHAAV